MKWGRWGVNVNSWRGFNVNSNIEMGEGGGGKSISPARGSVPTEVSIAITIKAAHL